MMWLNRERSVCLYLKLLIIRYCQRNCITTLKSRLMSKWLKYNNQWTHSSLIVLIDETKYSGAMTKSDPASAASHGRGIENLFYVSYCYLIISNTFGTCQVVVNVGVWYNSVDVSRLWCNSVWFFGKTKQLFWLKSPNWIQCEWTLQCWTHSWSWNWGKV